MLSLDSVKTRTIYSKQQIYALYIEFKGKLNAAYQTQSEQTINNLLLNIKAIYYLSGIPSFLKQLNQISQIQTLALLEVLFMKCSHWKSYKEIIQKWVSILMKQIGKFVPTYTIKQQISSVNFQPQKQQTDIKFFSIFLQKISKVKNQSSMFVSISFLRVFLIDQLQNKRRQFILISNNQLLPQWKNINESLLKMSHDLQNIKYQQICISICYWLCSQNKQFIKQCILKGAVTFLCQTLSNKNISQWYGRKILSFIKLLLLENQQKNDYYYQPTQIQSSIAQFTLKYDNQNIMQQARSLFACINLNINTNTNINTGQSKVQKQIKSYQKYLIQKNPKNLQNVIKNMRVLLLYSQDQKVRKQINQIHNLQYINKLIKKQDNIYLFSQILNIIAYNNNNNNNKNKNDKQNQIDLYCIQRVSNLLNSSKDKNQLLLNNKKILITLIRMLKQLIQSRQFSQKLLDKIKLEGIVKKFSKFSDCINFRYERELLSLIRILNSSLKNKQEKSNQSTDIMKALVKHMNENIKKVGRKLQDQLQQLELIYEMLQRGQTADIKPDIISSIFDKIKTKKNQTQHVQITILDQSQSQRSRQIINRINYLAIACLQKLQNDQKNKQNQVKNQDVDKVINIGLVTQDLQTIKIDTAYLIALSEHGKVNQNTKAKIAEVYSRYKQMLGQDSQLKFNNGGKKSSQDSQQIQQRKFKKGEILIQKSFKQQLQSQQLKQLQSILLSQQDIKLLQKFVQKYQKFKQTPPQSSMTIFLKFLLKLSQINEKKKQIFVKFSKFLSQNLLKCSDINSNLIFKIYSELYEDNIERQQKFFEDQLNKSYDFLSKDSVQFTSNCLYKLKYTGSETRQQNYWKYIYNTPESISREAAFLMNEGDTQKAQKFWSFFIKPILKNIQQEKKLTLHFLELIGSHVSKQIWEKFQLNGLLQKIMDVLKQRTSQLETKPISQVLIRKLLRLSKSIKEIVLNEKIQIHTLIPDLYTAVSNYLLTHPKVNVNNEKMSLLNKQYLKSLVQILKSIFKRRQGFSVVRKQLKLYEEVCKNIRDYNDSIMDDKLMESFRVLLLRDDRHEEFEQIVKIFNQNKIHLIPYISQVGKEHQNACQRIIEAVNKKNQKDFKKQYILYFFPLQNSKQNKKSAAEFTDEQLLTHLKNLLNPPYQYGINILEPFLRPVQTSQFANVLVQIFVNSQRLVEQDKENATKSLQDIQKSIADNIWGPGIQLNQDFYKMINMNLTGLKVCLKTKGIGIQGTTIVCQKFYEYPDQIPLHSQILYKNITSTKQWNVLLQKKIPQLINTIYKNKGKQQKYGNSLANLIGSSSKLKQIQNQYKIQNQLFQNLQIYKNNSICIAAILYAISGLVYLNQSNQKILSTKQRIKYYLKIIQQNNSNSLIFDRGCNLLSNMVHKNLSLIIIYIELSVQTIVIKIASSLLYEYSTYKQFLRLIGNLSLSLQAAHRIIKTQFLYLWANILKQAQVNKHDDIIKYCFDIIYNLLNYNQLQAKTIAYKIHQANCLIKIIQYLHRNSLVSVIVQAGLDTLDKILIIQQTRKQAIQKNILLCMQDIAKTQSWNQNILQKWIKLLYNLSKDQQAVKKMLQQSQIFGRLAIFIKQHQQIKYQYLNIVTNISDFIYQKGNHQYFINSGFIDLLVQLLKNKYLKSINASTIIDYFNNLHNQGILNSQCYTKIFGGLMTRLQLQFRDQFSKKIISSITKIRDHIVINTRAATILLQFAYIFLTQSQIITSQKYHKRVRQFICLLSYFISFSIQLKIIFRQQNFIEILNSWIKIDKTLDQDNSVSQACRICIFTIMNQQRFLINTNKIIIENKKDMYINKLSNNYKCYLYRRDHSNKQAIIKLRKQILQSKQTKQQKQTKQREQLQIISYKSPDGQIKLKYIAPLIQIIGIRGYQNNQDIIFKNSVFNTPKSIFQKNAISENCLTIIAIVGEQLSIRQIDVQFVSKEVRDQFMEDLKVIVSLEFQDSGKQV